VSHLHYDHLDLPSLERLGRSLRVIVPRGAARLLRRRGLSTVTEVEIGDEVRIGPVVVRATHAEHDGRRRPFGASAAAVGYLVTGSFTAYFAGDTDEFAAMSDLAPGLDVALLPVAGWGPRVPAGHLDPLRAAQALVRLQPRAAVPIHWGTYRRVGLDRDAALLRTPAESFAAFARDLAPEVDVRILDVGGTLVFPVARDGEVAARAGAGS
jgi:L-ascorbate metabolism protein UlaG (beta-lactamase superfamily)